MQVKECMRTDICTLALDATFRDALESMLKQKTNGAVIIQSQEDPVPVGILSSLDLVREAVPPYLREKTGLADFAAPDQFAEWIAEIETRPISDMMQKISHDRLLHETDSMEKAATLSAQDDLMYIPVVRRPEHRLVGLVSRTELKKAMAYAVGLTF